MHDLERDVITAFGHAVVEFEAALYQKFIMMSSGHSLITVEEFRKILQEMYAKGYISPLDLLGKKAWKKLVIEDRIDDALVPRRMMMSGETPPERMVKTKGRVVTESRWVADQIMEALSRSRFTSKSPEKRMVELQKHLLEMRKALTVSQNEFMSYVDRHFPDVKEDLANLLRSRGDQMLLLGIRVLEAVA
ncbi:MAG: hypothetical protein QXS20_00445 [Candidatus Thorarchaeota archaeon]